MSIAFRPEQSCDVAAIRRLTAAAFLEAPHTSHTEQFIVDALRNAGELTLSLVAEDAGDIVGHVAVSPVAISGGAGGWYGLGPVSVLPGRQRRGIGTRLIDEALAALRERGASGCVVLGEPEYYGRFGFTAEPALVLPGVPPEYFQCIALHGSVPQGNVSYSAAFDATA